MFAYDRFLANPSWPRTFALAGALAFGLLSKLSFPLFFLIGAICLSVARRRFPAKRFFAAAGVAFVIVWAGYFFTFGTIKSAQPKASEWSREVWGNAGLVRKLPLPAPAFFAGLLEVVRHDHVGHQSFLLGEYSNHGWWYYFPIALLVKTPIPMLALAIAGAWLAAKRERHGEVAAVALALLGVCMTSQIDIGVRHILPIYVPLSMLAAFAIVTGWQTAKRHRGAVALALVWLIVDSAVAHPDYLPWMNALAGPHPERVLADSNFDWGQDLVRLRTVCRERKIDRLGVLFVASGASDQLWMPLFDPNPIDPYRPAKGWIAVGETPLQMNQALDPNSYTWLTANRPFIRVGKTIRLYRVE
jgi:4-amino-4-deoxy-L-arabinose transferase-like glycosyltransferase